MNNNKATRIPTHLDEFRRSASQNKRSVCKHHRHYAAHRQIVKALVEKENRTECCTRPPTTTMKIGNGYHGNYIYTAVLRAPAMVGLPQLRDKSERY